MADLDAEIPDGSLEWRPKPISFPHISEEMIASLALGMEDDLVVAARHGMSVEDYQALASQAWFQLQIAAKRSEYEKNGVTFKAKAAWMAGELLDQVYLSAASIDASLNQKHEVLKTLMKAAGLEAKDEKVKDTGPTFAINIDLGHGQSISLTNANAIDVAAKELPQ